MFMENLKGLIRKIPLAVRLYRILRPQRVSYDGFANDKMLQRMVGELIQQFSASCFIETGSYLADTTCFMADKYPRFNILSCELNDEFYNKSRERLIKFKNVQLYKQNSPDFIKEIVKDDKLGVCPLFFLDAHWYDYWPLENEIDLITHNLKQAIIIIHDFQVPGRDDFYFDIGGGGSAEFSGRKTIDDRPCDIQLIQPKMNSENKYRILYPDYEAKDAFPKSSQPHPVVGYIIIFQNLGVEYNKFMKEQFPRNYFREGRLQQIPVDIKAPGITKK